MCKNKIEIKLESDFAFKVLFKKLKQELKKSNYSKDEVSSFACAVTNQRDNVIYQYLHNNYCTIYDIRIIYPQDWENVMQDVDKKMK